MKYWQFVNWEPAPIESALKSRVAVAIAAYENGDKKRHKGILQAIRNIGNIAKPRC